MKVKDSALKKYSSLVNERNRSEEFQLIFGCILVGLPQKHYSPLILAYERNKPRDFVSDTRLRDPRHPK